MQSDNRGQDYRSAVRLFITAMITAGVSVVLMIYTIESNHILSLVYISTISLAFGSSITQAVVAVWLRLKAGKNPFVAWTSDPRYQAQMGQTQQSKPSYPTQTQVPYGNRPATPISRPAPTPTVPTQGVRRLEDAFK